MPTARIQTEKQNSPTLRCCCSGVHSTAVLLVLCNSA